MTPLTKTRTSRGPPIPLREALETYRQAVIRFEEGEASEEELLLLQEKTEDIADEFDIGLYWFHSYVVMYGAHVEWYYIASKHSKERPRSS